MDTPSSEQEEWKARAIAKAEAIHAIHRRLAQRELKGGKTPVSTYRKPIHTVKAPSSTNEQKE